MKKSGLSVGVLLFLGGAGLVLLHLKSEKEKEMLERYSQFVTGLEKKEVKELKRFNWK
ncbi:MAG: hypothetical protein V1645_01980 [archaeon]